MIKIQINNDSYYVEEGTSISISSNNNLVKIGNRSIDVTEQKIITIIVDGNAGDIKTTSGDIVIKGNAKNVSSTSGDINIQQSCNGVSTVSGDVRTQILNGSVQTVSGDIYRNTR